MAGRERDVSAASPSNSEFSYTRRDRADRFEWEEEGVLVSWLLLAFVGYFLFYIFSILKNKNSLIILYHC